ncbi:MAG: ABC transporter ATP-binding protein [Thermoprotei archaeon]|nr:MAG: ABC transporter ATP-binding protein [Thermoprotei archaeon]RLF25362.1 MAG: ABC transporter ATP-binding protein [Thermoprotei archaeon]
MHLLEVDSLKTYYYTRKGIVKAVDGVNLHIDKREIVGVAGESGCGKTTLAMTIMRLLPPEARILSGKILFHGEDLLSKTEEEMREIRWGKISMIFQHSMNALNPVLTIERQMIDAIRAHDRKLTKAEAAVKARELFKMVGLDPDRIKGYQHEFSGGMRQRVMIAMALAADPELLIADEPTTGLDVITQSQILELLRRLKDELGLSIMIITHDLAVIAEVCDRVSIMYAGKVVEIADVVTLYKRPKHPYTYLLINAFPSIKSRRRRLEEIKGEPPRLVNPPPGCRFHPRCPYATEECRAKEPSLVEVEPGHYVACHYAHKLNFIMER